MAAEAGEEEAADGLRRRRAPALTALRLVGDCAPDAEALLRAAQGQQDTGALVRQEALSGASNAIERHQALPRAIFENAGTIGLWSPLMRQK